MMGERACTVQSGYGCPGTAGVGEQAVRRSDFLLSISSMQGARVGPDKPPDRKLCHAEAPALSASVPVLVASAYMARDLCIAQVHHCTIMSLACRHHVFLWFFSPIDMR